MASVPRRPDAASYKVCVGCDSLVSAKLHTCWHCDTYRFDSSTEAVNAVIEKNMRAILLGLEETLEGYIGDAPKDDK